MIISYHITITRPMVEFLHWVKDGCDRQAPIFTGRSFIRMARTCCDNGWVEHHETNDADVQVRLRQAYTITRKGELLLAWIDEELKDDKVIKV